MNISLIGAGNMGSALCKAFINDDVCSKEEMKLCDVNEEKLSQLEKDLGIQTSTDLEKILDSNIIILAVKPQSFLDLAEKLKDKIKEQTIVISIMAGITIETLQKELKHQKIIRTMPNTPALVNKGVIGWYADKNLSQNEKDEVQKILSSVGYAFEVKKESQIDDTTALSGCGPGFFFLIFDKWLKACESLELPEEKKRDILLKTLQGSLKLLEESEDSALELSQKVASKGGATERGLEVLENADLDKTFESMILEALKRCQEMAKER